MIEHRDEHGNVCTRHAPASETMLAWAAIGARISGFHHDTASKLQSLMMALDEAVDALGDDRPDVQRALDTAMTSLRDLHGLLTENRALAKAPQRKASPLAELLRTAAARHGVKLVGDLGPDVVFVAPPAIVHALALLLDVAAGAKQGARTVSVVVTTQAERVAVAVTAGAGAEVLAPTANEAICVATFLISREDGELRCAPNGFIVQLPLAAATNLRSAADSK